MAMIVVSDFILILFLIVGWIEARRILDLSRTCRCWDGGHELHKPSCDRGRVHRPDNGDPLMECPWLAAEVVGYLWRNEVFTDTPIAHHNDPAWFCARASWRAFRHAYGSFNKSVRVAAITDFAFFCENIRPFVFLRKSRSKVHENLQFLVGAASDFKQKAAMR
jgi:hypothetical protein